MKRSDFPSESLFANHIRELYYLGGYTIPEIATMTDLLPYRVKYYLYKVI